MAEAILYDNDENRYICFKHAVRKSLKDDSANITIEVDEEGYGHSGNDMRDTSCYECHHDVLRNAPRWGD